MVELMGPDPAVVAHQVLANVSLSLLPGQVARGRYPVNVDFAQACGDLKVAGETGYV